MLTKIRIVLVETSHPGNIGSVARAMKTMGLAELCLVRPHHFPHPDATALAAGADDILDSARIVESLTEALAPAQLVFGMTARSRSMGWPSLDPLQAAERMAREASALTSAAFVFGREQSGLTNDELAQCHYAVSIPVNPSFSSLNVAAAAQVMCYELRRHAISGEQFPSVESDMRYVATEDMEGFYEHCAEAMREVGFFDVGNPHIVMRRLRRLFSRTRLDENEHNIWRGFFRAVIARSGQKS